MSARREVFADLQREPIGVFHNKQRANRYRATTLFLTRTLSIAAGKAVQRQDYLETLRNAPLGDLLMAECSPSR
jgi:rhamnogalacturonyl hydrolase YesR